MVHLPLITLGEAASADDVDRLVASVRAELAALTLGLRVAEARAAQAEEGVVSLDDASLEIEQASMAEEVERARSHGAALVQAAQAAADALVGEARARAVRLVGGRLPSSELPARKAAAASPLLGEGPRSLSQPNHPLQRRLHMPVVRRSRQPGRRRGPWPPAGPPP